MRLLAKLRRRHPLPMPPAAPTRPAAPYSPDFFPLNTPYRARRDDQTRTTWSAIKLP
jgi:hypothetical protein